MYALDDIQVDVDPVVQLINRLLGDAIRRNALALRIDRTTDARSPIEFLISGEWVRHADVPTVMLFKVVNRFKIMAGLEYWKLDLVQIGTIDCTLDGAPYELRLTIDKSGEREQVLVEIQRPTQ